MNKEKCELLKSFPNINPMTDRQIDPFKGTYKRLGLKCYKYGYDLVPCSKDNYVRHVSTLRCRSKSPKRPHRPRSRSRSGPTRSKSPRSRSRRSRSRSQCRRPIKSKPLCRKSRSRSGSRAGSQAGAARASPKCQTAPPNDNTINMYNDIIASGALYIENEAILYLNRKYKILKISPGFKYYSFYDIKNGVMFDMASTDQLISSRKDWQLNFLSNNYRVRNYDHYIDYNNTNVITIKWYKNANKKICSSTKNVNLLLTNNNVLGGYEFVFEQIPEYYLQELDIIKSYGLMEPEHSDNGVYHTMYNIYTHPSMVDEGILFTIPQNHLHTARSLLDDARYGDPSEEITFEDKHYYDNTHITKPLVLKD